jgi:hypothetical protein
MKKEITTRAEIPAETIQILTIASGMLGKADIARPIRTNETDETWELRMKFWGDRVREQKFNLYFAAKLVLSVIEELEGGAR